mmetsp:Transcript_24686/g.38410  ORF Transcript_24686/g.38410 Transcript_24686/m.38410 type:complete len:142 (+) Transcript_24686:183-608(+)
MDPFVTFEYNDLTYKTRTAEEKGTSPQWNQVFEFYISDLKDEIVMKLWDKDVFYNDPIGIVCIKMSALCINGGGEVCFDVMYGEEIRGELHLLTLYTPKSMQQLTFDSEQMESIVREQEMQNNYTQTEIKGVTNKISEIQL